MFAQLLFAFVVYRECRFAVLRSRSKQKQIRPETKRASFIL
jgi:hypothetical protein